MQNCYTHRKAHRAHNNREWQYMTVRVRCSFVKLSWNSDVECWFEALPETLTVDATAYVSSEQTSNSGAVVTFQWICLKNETEINATNFDHYTTSSKYCSVCLSICACVCVHICVCICSFINVCVRVCLSMYVVCVEACWHVCSIKTVLNWRMLTW